MFPVAEMLQKEKTEKLQSALCWARHLQGDGCCAVFVLALEACTELQTSMGLSSALMY